MISAAPSRRRIVSSSTAPATTMSLRLRLEAWELQADAGAAATQPACASGAAGARGSADSGSRRGRVRAPRAPPSCPGSGSCPRCRSTRSKPARRDLPTRADRSRVDEAAPSCARRAAASGSDVTKRSVSRMTPSLKLRPSVRLLGVAERDLDAAAADVDHDRGPAHHVDAVHRREVDQARLLGAGDDAGADAGLARAMRARNSLAVLRLAGRARGGCQDLVDAVRLGDPAELGQREQRRAHGRRRSGSCRRARRRRGAPFPSRGRSPRTRGPRRTCTTIMWTEFVPMSMAARRMAHS